MNNVEMIKEILSHKIDITNVKLDDSLTSLGLDSLDLVEVVLEIEEKIGVELTSEEITSLATVQDVLDLVERKSK